MSYSIRRWKQDDTSVLMNYMNNIHIWSKLTDNTPIPFTENNAKEYISCEHPQLMQSYAVEQDGQIIGGVKLSCNDIPNNIMYRMDYWIDPELWVEEDVVLMLKEMVRFAFFHLPIMKIVVPTLGSDKQGHQVLLSAGFKEEAMITKAILKSGTIEDLHYFTIVE